MPHRDTSVASFFTYPYTMFTASSFTRRVVDRLRQRWFSGKLKSTI